MKTCPTCQMLKLDNRAKVGLLRPLEIPSRNWPHVTTDLVTNVPESNGYMAVAIFMDKLTKMVHLSYYIKEVTSMEHAKLFVDHTLPTTWSPRGDNI